MIPGKSVFLLLLSGALLAGPDPAAAQEKVKALEIEIEAGTLFSNYVWRGIRLSEGPVYQSSVTAGYRGFSLNLWNNFDFDSGEFNEVDFTASYSRELKKFTFETGLIHYGNFDLPDSDELFVSVSADSRLRPSLEAVFDVNAGNGMFLRPSIGHTFELSPRILLELGMAMGIVFQDSYMGTPDSGEEFTGLHNAEITAACPIDLGRGWTLKLQAAASTPLSRSARQAIVNSSVCRPGERFCNGTIVYGGITFSHAF